MSDDATVWLHLKEGKSFLITVSTLSFSLVSLSFFHNIEILRETKAIQPAVTSVDVHPSFAAVPNCCQRFDISFKFLVRLIELIRATMRVFIGGGVPLSPTGPKQ